MSTEMNRDRAIEALLKGGAASPRGVVSAHLAPDVLAAYVDEALTSSERSEAEQHLAACAECQAILRVIVDTAPEPAITARRWGAMKWLVPVMAAATAFVIWIAVPGQRSAQPLPGVVAPVAVSSSPSTSSVELPAAIAGVESRSAPELRDSRAAAGARAPVDLLKEKKEFAAKSSADSQLAAARPDAANQATRARTEADALRTEPAGTPVGATAAATPPPAPPPAPAPAAAPLGRGLGGAGGGGRAAAAAPPAAPVPTVLPPPVEAVQVAPLQETVQRRAALPLRQITSPDGSVVLRFIPGVPARQLERSNDRGDTWTPQPFGVEVTLTSAACPSRDVCWVIGRGGAILVSTDARTWRRIAFPAAVDLVEIAATDAMTATVTASDGRRFETQDGGRAWTTR